MYARIHTWTPHPTHPHTHTHSHTYTQTLTNTQINTNINTFKHNCFHALKLDRFNKKLLLAMCIQTLAQAHKPLLNVCVSIFPLFLFQPETCHLRWKEDSLKIAMFRNLRCLISGTKARKCSCVRNDNALLDNFGTRIWLGLRPRLYRNISLDRVSTRFFSWFIWLRWMSAPNFLSRHCNSIS